MFQIHFDAMKFLFIDESTFIERFGASLLPYHFLGSIYIFAKPIDGGRKDHRSLITATM